MELKLLLIIVLSPLMLFSESHKDDLHWASLKSVKEIEYYYYSRANEYIQEESSRSYKRYNIEGYMTSLSTLFSDDSIRRRTKYLRNCDNNLISAVTVDFKGAEIERVVYTYDNSGNKLSKITYSKNGEIVEKTLLEYNENNLKVKEFQSYNTILPDETSFYEYDENDRLILINKSTSENVTESSIICKYDEFGKVLETREKDHFFNTTITKYDYDEDEKLIEEIYTFKSKGELRGTINRKYNKYDKINEISSYNSKGDLEMKSVRSYDDFGNIVLLAEIDQNGNSYTEFTHEYLYDKNGNILEDLYFDENGNLSYRNSYVYDENNHLIEHYYKSETDTWDSGFYKKYDMHENLLQEIEIDDVGDTISIYTCNYDENDNPLEINLEYKITGYKTKEILEYDLNNNLIKHIILEFDEILRTTISKYNEDNKILETAIYNSNNELIEKKTFKYEYDQDEKVVEMHNYDTDGRLIKQEIYGENTTREEYEFDYDDKESFDITRTVIDGYGNVISKTSIFPGASFFPFKTYRYNSYGEKVEYSKYDTDSVLVFKEYYDYDQNHNLINTEKVYSYGDTVTSIAKYNEYNKKIEFICYNNVKEVTYRETYKYCENNEIIERCEFDAENKLRCHETITFEENKETRDVIEYDAAGLVTKSRNWNYLYDNNDNWIERKEYRDNKPDRLSIREIEYY